MIFSLSLPTFLWALITPGTCPTLCVEKREISFVYTCMCVSGVWWSWAWSVHSEAPVYSFLLLYYLLKCSAGQNDPQAPGQCPCAPDVLSPALKTNFMLSLIKTHPHCHIWHWPKSQVLKSLKEFYCSLHKCKWSGKWIFLGYPCIC